MRVRVWRCCITQAAGFASRPAIHSFTPMRALTDTTHNISSSLDHARALFEGGSVEMALATYREIAEATNGLSHEALSGCADALSALGRHSEAREKYSELVALRPLFTPAYAAVAQCLLAEGEYEAAVTAADRVLAQDAGYTPAYGIRGEAALHQGHHRAAQRDFRKVLVLDSNNASAMAGLGVSLLACGERPDGLEMLNSAIRVEPSNATALRTMAGLALEEGDIATAESHLTRLLDAEPGAGDALFMRGTARLAGGMLEDALADGNHAADAGVQAAVLLIAQCHQSLGQADVARLVLSQFIEQARSCGDLQSRELLAEAEEMLSDL